MTRETASIASRSVPSGTTAGGAGALALTSRCAVHAFVSTFVVRFPGNVVGIFEAMACRFTFSNIGTRPIDFLPAAGGFFPQRVPMAYRTRSSQTSGTVLNSRSLLAERSGISGQLMLARGIRRPLWSDCSSTAAPLLRLRFICVQKLRVRLRNRLLYSIWTSRLAVSNR